jgi:type VI secretion system protein ImpF
VARRENELHSVPSLLDRLIDDSPELLGNGLEDLRGAERTVVRDLENLLNTRREALRDPPQEFTELNKSLLVYGLPDVTAYNLLDPNDRNRLRRTLEAAISIFEPRLQRVRVSMTPPGQNDGALHFRIEALLRVEPAPEPVAFDTVLQLDTQKYSVRS